MKPRKPLWQYCADKRTREGKPTPRLKRSPLRPVSRQRRSVAPARETCRQAVYARCSGLCEAKTPDCTGACEQVHEIKARSAGGSIVDPANCLGVCAACHEWIQLHHNEARTMGLVAPRGV